MPNGKQNLLEAGVLVGQGPEADAVAEHLAALCPGVRRVPCPADVRRDADLASAELLLILDDVPHDETLALLGELASAPARPRTVVAAAGASAGEAVELMKAGACDVITQPLSADVLGRLAEGIAEDIDRVGGKLERFFCEDAPPGVAMVGRSDGAAETLRMLRLVAESRCNPVLVTGETGTGKELAARAVHAWRCGDPEKFVAVNCAALTANLLESELFGHVRGAFTGADRDKTGLLELAGTGTIFLDEISEMAPDLQAKLLRVLQERTFRKVGGTTDLPCEATVVASSNRDLPAEVRAGRFRKDLYYRLAVFPVALQPLRAARRREDVPLLAEYFLATSDIRRGPRATDLTAGARRKLLAHDWPGNVRELRNVIDRALILAGGEKIEAEHVAFDLGAAVADEPAPPSSPPADTPATPPCEEPAPRRPRKDFSLETAEREFILRALKETGWQRTRAAALLGITRATLHAKLKRYDIQPPEAGKKLNAFTGRRESQPLAEAPA